MFRVRSDGGGATCCGKAACRFEGVGVGKVARGVAASILEGFGLFAASGDPEGATLILTCETADNVYQKTQRVQIW